jgi:hypothetical protein
MIRLRRAAARIDRESSLLHLCGPDREEEGVTLLELVMKIEIPDSPFGL